MSLVTIFVCSIDVWTLHVTVGLSWTTGKTLHSVKFTSKVTLMYAVFRHCLSCFHYSVSPHTDANPLVIIL